MVAVPALYSFALAALVFGPLFGPGHLLLRDAVSTPRSYLTDSALGLTDAAPRAVPQDWLLAVTSSVVDGGVVVKVILFLALWFAAWGGAALVREMLGVGLGPQLVAATVVLWNPFVAERLLQGHWSLLTGYAALPWIGRFAPRESFARSSPRNGLTGAAGPLAVCLAAAALTPTGALLATVVAIVTWRRVGVLVVAVVAVLASAPWLVATFLSGSGSAASDPAGVAAFAARAEPGLGTLGSLAGLGGIWNSTAVPDTRTTLFALVGTMILLAIVGLGVVTLWRRRVLALPILAVVTIVLIALAATPWGLDAGRWAVENVPGAGLFRDSQKWVALAAPGFALGAAAGAQWLADRVAFAPVVLIVLLGVALPDLAWGVGGQLKPVHYPSSWEQVAARVDGGDVAVLPTGMFRVFPYTGNAPVLDPAPRMLPADVLQTGELQVAGGAVEGEGGRARDVEKVLLAGGSPRQLTDLHVRWVLVERTSKGPLGDSARTLAGLSRVFEDRELALYRVDGTPPSTPADGRGITIAAHVVWIVLLAGGVLGQVVFRRRRADQP